MGVVHCYCVSCLAYCVSCVGYCVFCVGYCVSCVGYCVSCAGPLSADFYLKAWLRCQKSPNNSQKVTLHTRTKRVKCS